MAKNLVQEEDSEGGGWTGLLARKYLVGWKMHVETYLNGTESMKFLLLVKRNKFSL